MTLFLTSRGEKMKCKKCRKELEAIYFISLNTSLIYVFPCGVADSISRILNKNSNLCADCFSEFIQAITGKGFFNDEKTDAGSKGKGKD